MPRGKAHSDETRAAVVAALLAGLGVRDVARQHNIDPAFVSRVKSSLDSELKQVETEKRVRIDDLILTTVRTNLEAMNRIAKTVSEPSYLKTQAAKDCAELYRELSSTTLDILEAASTAGIDAEE